MVSSTVTWICISVRSQSPDTTRSIHNRTLTNHKPNTGGWDGRSRMPSIDMKKCPVYMLTGEYDWSNTLEMGQATCDKITSGKHQATKGVGHFPATENPKVFIGYCKFDDMVLIPNCG
jgi:pimeloyl-ACP methyl ester carboxylesterase